MNRVHTSFLSFAAGGLLLASVSTASAHNTCLSSGCCTPHGGTTVNAGYYNVSGCAMTVVYDSIECGLKPGPYNEYTYGRKYCSTGTGALYGCPSGQRSTGYSSGHAYRACNSTGTHFGVTYGAYYCKSTCL